LRVPLSATSIQAQGQQPIEREKPATDRPFSEFVLQEAAGDSPATGDRVKNFSSPAIIIGAIAPSRNNLVSLVQPIHNHAHNPWPSFANPGRKLPCQFGNGVTHKECKGLVIGHQTYQSTS